MKLHLYKSGFYPNYYQWNYYDERDANLGDESSTFASNRLEDNQMRDVVMDALGPTSSTWDEEGSTNVEEDPNLEMKAFFDMIEAAEKPLYEGSH